MKQWAIRRWRFSIWPISIGTPLNLNPAQRESSALRPGSTSVATILKATTVPLVSSPRIRVQLCLGPRSKTAVRV